MHRLRLYVQRRLASQEATTSAQKGPEVPFRKKRRHSPGQKPKFGPRPAPDFLSFDAHLENLAPRHTDWALFAYFRQTCLPETPPARLSPAYGRLINHIAANLRDNYNDPHLALALYQLAEAHPAPQIDRAASTAEGYMLRAETIWETWADVRAVLHTIEEFDATVSSPEDFAPIRARMMNLLDSIRERVGDEGHEAEENGEYGDEMDTSSPSDDRDDVVRLGQLVADLDRPKDY